LYDGWAAEANGDHARILLNATIWLATPNRTATATRRATDADFSIYPNPSADALYISGNVLPTEIRCQDMLGQQVALTATAAGAGALRVETAGLAPGLYVLRLRLPDGQVLTRQIARQ
ncbi:T9SS type A sorting domain-containing protein, partial [Hymenobacter agri]